MFVLNFEKSCMFHKFTTGQIVLASNSILTAHSLQFKFYKKQDIIWCDDVGKSNFQTHHTSMTLIIHEHEEVTVHHQGTLAIYYYHSRLYLGVCTFLAYFPIPSHKACSAKPFLYSLERINGLNNGTYAIPWPWYI